jgi:FkbM family methyltransferase
MSSEIATAADLLLLPDGLAAGEQWFLVGDADDATAARVRALLTWASPGAICVGVGRYPPAGVTEVWFEPDALSLIAARSPQQPGTTCRYLPLPVDYPWAFWDVWAWYDDRPELRQDLTSFEAFRHAFRRCSYLGGPAVADRLDRWRSLEDEHFYWRSSADAFEKGTSAIDAVRARLADAQSRAVFDLALRSDPQELWTHFITRVFGTIDYLDHATPRRGDHVLNLGVFTGHEVPYLLPLVGESGCVHCIDPVGFDLLSGYVRAVAGAWPGQVREARFAAGAAAGEGCFRSYPDGQVCLDAPSDAGVKYPVAAVDDYIDASGIEPVGFVKVDVEGMEPASLDGLVRTCARHRPIVSVAIYHCVEHLWELPLRLMASLEDYRFHISHTSPVRWETVLTAVPGERAGDPRPLGTSTPMRGSGEDVSRRRSPERGR